MKSLLPSFGRELLASVVVFLVALPLCMGIAIASGAPPALGLLTGIIGGLVVGAIQGAPLQVSGPAAGLVVLTHAILAEKGVASLGIAVLGAGILQLAAGLARGGRWFRAVPPAVVHGMLAGIGVLIVAAQIHVMVDDKPASSALTNVLLIPRAFMKAITPTDLPHEEAAAVGVVTIVAIVAWNKLVPKRARVIPGALVGVVVGSLAANTLNLPVAFVSLPDDLLGSISLPRISGASSLVSGSTIVDVVTLAVVASAETMLCAAAADRMHTGPRANYDRELAAQGVGNILCGLVGALPMTGVVVRTSANVQAGAKTRVSSMLHGAWILLVVVAFPGLLRLVPIASLAAVLVFTGLKLVNLAVVKELRRHGWAEVGVYAVTVLTIVGWNLLAGVLVGVALSVLRLVYRLSHVEVRLEDDASRGRTTLHLGGAATFLRLPEIAEKLERVPHDRAVHVRFEDLAYLDGAIMDLLASYEAQRRARGGDVVIDWSRHPKMKKAPRPPGKPGGQDAFDGAHALESVNSR